MRTSAFDDSRARQRFEAHAQLTSGDMLRTYSIPLPPLPEQRAIAAALSDVDALLGALDRLIAKKRDLKQAAMQQLLTGQTRLPGFSGEWEAKRFGELGAILTGARHHTSRVLHVGDIAVSVRRHLHERRDDRRSHRLHWHASPTRSQSTRYAARSGDVLFASRGRRSDEIGKLAIATS